MNGVAKRGARAIADYDPDKGLLTIAVAEAGERHWARAKDHERLFAAIEAKITAQAEYIVWRDSVIIPSRQLPGAGQGKGKRVSGLKPSNSLPTADPGDVTAHRWRKKLCGKGPLGATIIDPVNFGLAIDDAQRRALRICEQQKMGTVRGTEGTGEFELFTPAAYVALVREVLNEIDLDPASNEQAQATIRAKVFYTVKDNGLEREWPGRVFLNPPYHRDLAPLFVRKLIEEHLAGRTTEAVMLVNNATDTEWFYLAQGAAQAICFTRGRINFLRPGGEIVFPTQGQAFFYLGANRDRFHAVFEDVGWICRPEGVL